MVNNHDSGTPGNLSVSQNMRDLHNTSVSITLNWSQPLHNYKISCCPAPYNGTNCTLISYSKIFARRSEVITGLNLSTIYECCLWPVHKNREGQPSCQCVQTNEDNEDGIVSVMLVCILSCLGI